MCWLIQSSYCCEVSLTRQMWSNSPNHGARIVATTLNNPTLYQEWWEKHVTLVLCFFSSFCLTLSFIQVGQFDHPRIKAMREALFQLLKTQGTPGDWTHVLKQTGMFSYTGLTRKRTAYTHMYTNTYLYHSSPEDQRHAPPGEYIVYFPAVGNSPVYPPTWVTLGIQGYFLQGLL